MAFYLQAWYYLLKISCSRGCPNTPTVHFRTLSPSHIRLHVWQKMLCCPLAWTGGNFPMQEGEGDTHQILSHDCREGCPASALRFQLRSRHEAQGLGIRLRPVCWRPLQITLHRAWNAWAVGREILSDPMGGQPPLAQESDLHTVFVTQGKWRQPWTDTLNTKWLSQQFL